MQPFGCCYCQSYALLCSYVLSILCPSLSAYVASRLCGIEKCNRLPKSPEILVFVSKGCLLHSEKKSTSEHLFWCFRLSQIEDSIQYLEGPNITWKDHDRNLGVQMDKRCSSHGPSRYYLVLSGNIWSFQVLNRVLYL